MHNMLHEAGKNWSTDLTAQQKNGTFLIAADDGISERHDILPTYDSVNGAIGLLVEYQ